MAGTIIGADLTWRAQDDFETFDEGGVGFAEEFVSLLR